MPRRPTFPACFDEVKRISITDLRRLGYLREGSRVKGVISWTRGERSTGSVGITVYMPERYLELDYLCNDKPICYRVRLTTVPSNLGFGDIWYFVCPFTGKRCRMLYGIGDHFYSRYAYRSAMYSSQTESKLLRGLLAFYHSLDERRFDKRYSRTHYKGRPTRRYLKWLDRSERRDAIFERAALHLQLR